MIDLQAVRNDLDSVKAAIARRHDPSLLDDLDQLARLDEETRAAGVKVNALRERVNALSKEVGEAFKAGNKEEGERLRAESRAAGEDEAELTEAWRSLEEQRRDVHLRIPNIPSDDSPDGASDADNPVIREANVEGRTYEAHQRVPHWDTGAELDILDLERATKISGSMFAALRGNGARLSRALCQLALDAAVDAGFEEVRPPTLVRSATLEATGQLPKFADESYFIERDDLWAIPTAEVPLTSLYRDEVLGADELPKRMVAYSPCYRREAGAAGRDTRGLLRTHEFDKVEVLALTTPEEAPRLLDELVDRCESTIRALALPYRVIEICTGDLGQSHHRSFDIEVYAPGVDAWLEVSSVSWFSDYQARRASIRYRRDDDKGIELVHTLNGSALAVPRVFASILEVYREADGRVRIPEVLLPYFGGAQFL